MSTGNVTLLVTGANGQLGQQLLHTDKEGIRIIGFGRDRLDVTNLSQCREVLSEIRPDGIIHAAAYTAVDKAEAESDLAYRVNAIGTRNMAIAAEENGTKLLYVSTDYVFDGGARIPYNEYDCTNPQSVYGKSKRAGEAIIQSLSSRYFIVRTSWLYGKYGSNFVKTMVNLAKERDSVTVVCDQFGSPTYTLDLAEFLVDLVRSENYGIYHASNSGSCSWHEFAQAIFEESGLAVQVESCNTDQFHRPAPRPAYSVLDHSSIRQQGLPDFRPWRDALRAFLQELK